MNELEVDARGLYCPIPILRLAKAFRTSPAGTVSYAFDTAGLAHWMQAHIEGFSGPIELRQFAGGQSNPTFLVQSADHRYVLRRKPPGKLLPSAHAVDREYRVITALAKTEVPVAKATGEEADEAA